MKIKYFIQNIFSVNTYLVWDEVSKEAILIDPGCSMEQEEEEIASFIEKEGLTIKYLLNTHCHIDHIFGNAYIKNKYNPQYLAPEGDVFLLEIMVEHAGDFGVTMNPSPIPDSFIKNYVSVSIGGYDAKFIPAPGHTPDGYCVYFENEKVCFTGDTLFNEGIGRTDLWGGNFSTLMKSIKENLLSLPDDVVIYPGHGDKSTIGYEKNNNPFIA